MDLQVRRYSFFDGGSQTLQFEDSCPPLKEDHDHAVCNCTRHCATRPTGTPFQTRQSLHWTGVFGKYRASLAIELEEGAALLVPHFTLRWDNPYPHPDSGKWRQGEDHAYFWWHRNGLQVEISGTGDNSVDCSFGRLHFGNDVDTSCFYNGHSPSEIVDLATFGSDEVWAHDCHWGREAVVRFPPGEETDGWLAAHRRAKELSQQVKDGIQFDADVKDIHARVLENKAFPGLVEDSFVWLLTILKDLKSTEMYRAIDSARRETRKKKESR